MKESTTINFRTGSKAIYGYRMKENSIEINLPGSSVLFKDPAEVSILKRWIKEAKSFAKNQSEICTYLEYMFDFGQFEN